MNIAELQRRLIAASRSRPPSDSVPYAFEKRIMSRLPLRPALDLGTLWATALWRAAAPCIALMLLLSAWSVCIHVGNRPSTDLCQDLENTLFAVDQEQSADSLW
jgi:hypothetical protein